MIGNSFPGSSNKSEHLFGPPQTFRRNVLIAGLSASVMAAMAGGGAAKTTASKSSQTTRKTVR
jgi:non-heme chloroperoxidase